MKNEVKENIVYVYIEHFYLPCPDLDILLNWFANQFKNLKMPSCSFMQHQFLFHSGAEVFLEILVFK